MANRLAFLVWIAGCIALAAFPAVCIATGNVNELPFTFLGLFFQIVTYDLGHAHCGFGEQDILPPPDEEDEDDTDREVWP